jgi:hypothetical protein
MEDESLPAATSLAKSPALCTYFLEILRRKRVISILKVKTREQERELIDVFELEKSEHEEEDELCAHKKRE